MNQLAALRTAVTSRIARSAHEPFAVLDFDNTCIVNDIAEATLAHLCRSHLLRCDDLVSPAAHHGKSAYHRQVFRRYHELMRRGDIKSASLLCASALAGFARDEVEAIVSAVIDAEGSTFGETELHGIRVARGIGVRPALRDLIALSTANGVQVWIVSASPEALVRAAMSRFGLTGQLIGLRNRMDGEILLKECDEPHSVAEGKVDCIKTFIDAGKRPLIGVSDSISDLPMLTHAEFSVVVDRDPALTEIARRHGWLILPA